MVVVLQQKSTDSGKRFVTTLIEEDISNNFSAASVGDQNSISERSAIYKQRIDSLFGKNSRKNVSNLGLSAGQFCFKVEQLRGNSKPEGIISRSSTKENVLEEFRMASSSSALGLAPSRFCNGQGEGTSGLSPKNPKNHKVSFKDFNEKETSVPHTQQLHVSTVNLNWDEHNNMSSHSPLPTTSNPNPKNDSSDIQMWRNGTYGTREEVKNMGARNSPGGILQFPVEYLGCVPVEGSTTTLQDLQPPLKTLYLNFLTGQNLMSGQLSITSDGIRFEASKLRLVNPFSTIAVWAAIKFVAKGDPVPTDCAFMPLISDPEGQDKEKLFGRMEPQLTKAYLSCLSITSRQCFKNPPIFACVMREASFSLDCHAFACKCAEDAIVMAANLYQVLMDKMRIKTKEIESGYGTLTRTSPQDSSPRLNGNITHKRPSSSASSEIINSESCCSSTGNTSSTTTELNNNKKSSHRVIFSDTESIIPIRPPRRKKKYYDGCMTGNLKRHNSEDSVLSKIPQRRKSFKALYNPHQRPYYTKNKKRVKIFTPETISCDSVNESIDQVLDRIINPGGMSFNDLKPSYQELILKIALTLTQDQLYQKTKEVMKKQQLNPSKNKKNGISNGNHSGEIESSQFLGNLLRPFSKITSGKIIAVPGAKRGGSPEKNSKELLPTKVILKKSKDHDEFMSFCSGCMCDNCSEKCYCSLPSKHNLKLKGLSPSSGNPSASTDCQSESTLTTEKEARKAKCGYDTDSCAESEKCYCSLQKVKSNGLKVYNINLDTETSDTDTNSYDLETFNQTHCSDSSSCSTNLKTMSTQSVEVLSYNPARRFPYYSSSAVVKGSPHHIHTSALVHSQDSCQSTNSDTGTNGLPSCVKKAPFKPTSSYDMDSNDTVQQDSPSLRQRKKVLLLTGKSQVVYKDRPYNFHSRLPNFGGELSIGRSLGDITEDEDFDELENESVREETEDSDGQTLMEPDQVIAMKKTAEIEAMFTNMRIEKSFPGPSKSVQNLIPEPSNSTQTEKPHCSQVKEETKNGVDFETSLGYLP